MLVYIQNASVGVFIIFLINIALALMIIFLERKNPSATLAWIMILFLLPVFGILLYFLISQNIARKKIFKLKAPEERIIGTALRNQMKEIADNTFNYEQPEFEEWKSMIRLHQTLDRSFFTQDNIVDIFTDGKDKFDKLIKDIQNATSHIHMMYFIFQNDSLGRTIIDQLTEKAKQGVEVRLLLDAMGSSKITPEVLCDFTKAGGKYSFFFPSKIKIFNLKLNYRNHRKLVVIDGKIGYLGGFNVGNEYLGKKKKVGYWRDTHLRITGSSVYDLQMRFILDWRFSSKEDLDISIAYYQEPSREGNTGIQIVSSGSDTKHEEIKHGYLKMISSAKKRIIIQTPYFIPDYSILESLKNAALSGVELSIMIPCKPDHVFVYWATYSYIGELLDTGAKIYIYNNGFLHAKMICVDGKVASIGSANFDIRSFRLNFEVNAFIYDSATVINLEEIFDNDIKYSEALTLEKYKNRPLYIKLKESISRLLSDLL